LRYRHIVPPGLGRCVSYNTDLFLLRCCSEVLVGIKIMLILQCWSMLLVLISCCQAVLS